MLALAGVLAACTALSGCLGTGPEPTPTPTAAFASEEEAFAAAEETYRAYVAAANDVDLSDPATFESMFAWTTGELENGARKTFSEMHADGWAVDGETRLTLIEPLDASSDFAEIELAVCQDVSDVTVVDDAGESVVSPSRPNMQSLIARLVVADTSPTGYLVEEVNGREGDPACGG